MEKKDQLPKKIKYFKLPPFFEDLKCSICLDYFDNPFFSRCSHTFCYECAKDAFSRKLNCPTCRVEIHEMIPNFIAKKLVENLEVCCSNNTCDWIGKRKELIEHLGNCKFKSNTNSLKLIDGFNSDVKNPLSENEEDKVNVIKSVNTSLTLRDRIAINKQKELRKLEEVRKNRLDNGDNKDKNKKKKKKYTLDDDKISLSEFTTSSIKSLN